MSRLAIIGSILSIAIINFLVNLNFNSPKEEINNEDTNEKVASNELRKIKSQSKREPASSSREENPGTYKAAIKRSEVDKSNFVNPPPFSESTPDPVSNGNGGYQSFSSRTPSSIPFNGNTGNIDSPTATPKNTKATEQILSENNSVSIPYAQKDSVENNTHKTTIISSSGTSSNSTSSASIQSTCSANIEGGSFGNPIGITLSCSSASTIKYCVALDTGSGCCDPLSSGSTYSSAIVIGPQNGTYCLSYYGQMETDSTDVYQQSYTINSTLPNLQVGHPQINYQTTQLNGKSFITSSDFGKNGYGIGQINLKSNAPGPSGLNYTCNEIIANYVSLPAPTPTPILSLLNVSLDNPSVQIEIPLQPTQLEYGDNFITSYIENNNFVAPIYSCSTTKITLNDFEYFQEELTFGDPGSNSVREFTGGLSPYGFFEDASNVYRGPAGADTHDNSGQKLEYGMFGIFY